MMLLALAFGFLLSYAGMLVGRCLYRNRTALEMAGGMLCCSGYNIANFAIPFCQSFFPIAATGYLGMFDVGNCIMCLGGTNAFAEMALHEMCIRDRFKVVPLMIQEIRSAREAK